MHATCPEGPEDQQNFGAVSIGRLVGRFQTLCITVQKKQPCSALLPVHNSASQCLNATTMCAWYYHNMLLAALSMVCVPTIHCNRIHRPLPHQRSSLRSWILAYIVLDLQGGNHQNVMCRSQLMDREALQHVLQTVAYVQHSCNAMGVQRVIAACAHAKVQALKPTNREAQHSGTAQCP